MLSSVSALPSKIQVSLEDDGVEGTIFPLNLEDQQQLVEESSYLEIGATSKQEINLICSLYKQFFRALVILIEEVPPLNN